MGLGDSHLPPTRVLTSAVVFAPRQRDSQPRAERQALEVSPAQHLPSGLSPPQSSTHSAKRPRGQSPLSPLSQQPLHPLQGPRRPQISVGWCPLSDRTQMPPEYLLRAERWASGAGTQGLEAAAGPAPPTEDTRGRQRPGGCDPMGTGQVSRARRPPWVTRASCLIQPGWAAPHN